MTLQTLKKVASSLKKDLSENKITKQEAMSMFLKKFTEAFSEIVAKSDVGISSGAITEEDKEEMLEKYKQVMIDFSSAVSEVNFEGCMNKPKDADEQPAKKELPVDEIKKAMEEDRKAREMNWDEFYARCKFEENEKYPQALLTSSSPAEYNKALKDMINRIKAYIRSSMTVVLWKTLTDEEEDSEHYATVFGCDSHIEADSIAAFSSLAEVHNELYRQAFGGSVVLSEDGVDINAQKVAEIHTEDIVDELFDMLVTVYKTDSFGKVGTGALQVLYDQYECEKDKEVQEIPCVNYIAPSAMLDSYLEQYFKLKERVARYKALY